MRSILLACTLCTVTAACGIKGPLVLPDPSAMKPPAKAASTDGSKAQQPTTPAQQ